MKLEHKILTIAIAAIILAVPVAIATQHRTNLLKVEKSQSNTLQLQLKTKTEELQLNNIQLEKERQKTLEQQKLIDDQKKQIEAKAAQAALVASYKVPNCAAYKGLVAQYDWPVDTAMAVMQAESGCRAITPDNAAANYDGIADHGLFQLHGMDVIDPAENVRLAYTVKYVGAGRKFTPWVAFNTGAYLKYL